MRRGIETSLVFLLTVPLLLGAVPSRQQDRDNTTTPTTELRLSSSDMEIESPHTLPSPLLESNGTANAPIPVASSITTTYVIDWYSINGGGTGGATSASYLMGVSVGQSVAGEASSTNYQMGIGFWYGVGGRGDGCTCPCWADPACDGVKSDIQDVVHTVNVAFRGTSGVFDPGCPVERTDVEANGSTSVTDVVKVINVAFRGQSDVSNYVNPCLTSEPTFIRGDADCNGVINSADVDYLVAFVFVAGPPPPCRDAGDVNDDGAINSSDITNLNSYLLGSFTPPAPFPACGVNPTADGLDCVNNCCGP